MWQIPTLFVCRHRVFQKFIDKNYLKQRAALINPNQSMGVAPAGNFNTAAGVDTTVEHGTTQFTIVDAYGNIGFNDIDC